MAKKPVRPVKFKARSRIKVWYVLIASGFTSESSVRLFPTQKEAEDMYERERVKFINDATEDGSTLGDLKDDGQYRTGKYKSGSKWSWLAGEVLDGGTDRYVEIGSQIV